MGFSILEPQMDDDAELLQRWRDGDAVAGNRLFQRFFVVIYRFFVNKTRSLADTEELTQSTFEELMKARDRFAGKSALQSYVLGIANNLLKRYYRDLARMGDQLDPLASSIVALGAGAQTQLECAEAQQLLLLALREIPADFQIVLELYYVEALDADAIADATQTNPNTVRSRLQRGREHLREKLGELAARSPDVPAPDDGDWPLLIRGAFPARIVSPAFMRDEHTET